MCRLGVDFGVEAAADLAVLRYRFVDQLGQVNRCRLAHVERRERDRGLRSHLVADIRAVMMGCRRCRRLADSRGRGRWAAARRAGSGLSETSAAGLGTGLGAGADLGARAGLGLGAGAPVSSSQLCVASAQLRPNLRSTRIGTESLMASQPRRATISPCSRVVTLQSNSS